MIGFYQALRMEMGSGSILGYFLQALPVVLLAGLVYVVTRILWVKKAVGRRHNWPAELMRCLFVCYLAGLVCLVILPANYLLSVYDALFFGWWAQIPPLFRLGNVNLTPTVLEYTGGSLALGSWVRQMLVLNVAMLIPFGFFLPLLTAKARGKSAFLIAILSPLAIETLQFFIGRSFDIDDLLCNFIGILIGLLLAWAVRKLASTSRPA